MKYKKLLAPLSIILIFIVMILIISYTPILVRFKNNGKLIINEVLPINKNVIDVEGNYYDYIELYNGNDYDINLEGYHLSDDSLNLKKWTFPEVTIKANSYLLVYTSGLDTYKNNTLHTNFKLNSKGETLTLSNKNADVLSRLYYEKTNKDTSYGYNGKEYVYFYNPTPGSINDSDYSKEPITIEETKIITGSSLVKEIRINEVEAVNKDVIELKNLADKDIDLSNYYLMDNSDTKQVLSGTIKANSYLVISDLTFGINNTNEKIRLFKDDNLIDTYNVGKLRSGISSGINSDNDHVYYKEITLGRENSNNYYLGYSNEVIYSIDGGYVDKGTTVELSSNDNSTIYYTLDGSYPNNRSSVYTEPIKIDRNVVIKTIAYKDNYLESDITSRTYIVDRKHDLPVVSLSTDSYNLFGTNGIISNYKQDSNRPISFEYYENGKLGTSFNGDTKLSGMDSREQPQKSMAIYLRKEYGKSEVTYPFFGELKTYSSLLLRNAGEDPKRIRIMDAVLTRTLDGQMDIDIQDYRPVVVYINGEYYGMYNLREKLNSDYIETNYKINKEEINLVRYKTATKGSIDDYNNLLNYINTHNVKAPKVYEYIKNEIDIQELINYVIAEAYYGNTDLGNIRYWKANDGKWRFMLYDLDWSMWNSNLNISYPVLDTGMPAKTYLYSVYFITRELYKNEEFKDLYLKTLSYHLKNTFIPSRMNKIVDDLAKEIESELPYHFNKWKEYHMTMDKWHNNINSFKNMIELRYRVVTSRIKEEFSLTTEEYNKYFGDLNE